MIRDCNSKAWSNKNALSVYRHALCHWQTELKVLLRPIQYIILFWISVQLMLFIVVDQMFPFEVQQHWETLPVALSVPPPVGSSSMSTGPASSSLTPVLSASARVLTRTHGCGV